MQNPQTTSLPSTMRVVEISGPGGPEVLVENRRSLPKLCDSEVLIRVAAAGVNRPDLLQRQGAYAPPPDASDLPGLEVSGWIADLGTGTAGADFKIGDEVLALCNGGGYAEYCAVPVGQVLPKPHRLTMVEAAGIAETCFTVWTNLFQRAKLKSGESLLVHGGASGIGTTAIQMASALGVKVLVTARGVSRCQACLDLGASLAIDREKFAQTTGDFVAAVMEATGNKGVDVILDMVGGDYSQCNLEALAVDGRLVQIAHLQGAKVAIDLSTIMRKRLTVTGSTLRPRSQADKAQIARELCTTVWPLIESGKLKPLIAHSFPLADAAAAHRTLEAGEVVGKVILLVAPPTHVGIHTSHAPQVK